MARVKHHVSQLVTWHFWSSTLFEGLKAAHQSCLFIALPLHEYATIGAIFSMIYLSCHLFGFEGGSALIPFASSIANASNRHSLISRYLVIPQLFLQGTGAAFLHTFLTQPFVSSGLDSLHLTLFTAISTLEGLRMALRSFAHTILDSKAIIPFETTITILYFAVIWSGYLFFGMDLNLKSLLIPYFATSLIATLFLLNAVYHYPSRLPRMKTPIPPTPYQNIRMRISLTILHLPRNLFSANLLVPFFARINVGLASIIKLASSVANAVKSIVKGSIGFSANAIFSTYISSRTQAFNMLWNYLVAGISATLIISGMMTIPCFILDIMRDEAIIIMAFCLLCMLDYLFILYEHFFIVSNTSATIATYRIIETVLSATLLWYAHMQPATIIGGLIAIRLIALTATIYRAHILWRIKPKVRMSSRTLAFAIIAGVGMAGVSTYIKLNIIRRNPSAARPTPLFLEPQH